MKTNQNTTEAVEVLQEWRDENGNVDLAAVRSGMVDIRHQDAIFTALLDEVEQMRVVVARSQNALAELDRYQSAYLPGVRARQLVDAALSAVGGKSDPCVFVSSEEDIVYVGDGVTAAAFTVSEAYTVMHGLAKGLPKGRSSLGISGGES